MFISYRPEDFDIVIYTDKEDKPPPYHHFIPSTSTNISSINLGSIYLNQKPPGSQEITEDIPKELQFLIEEEKEGYEKKHGTHDEKLQWPITSTRDAHKDDDVFIARANNPFGHSVKWKYR